MKILENQQVRGILVGVLFGLIVAFTLQAFDVALWLCLGAGLVLGLEAGFFAAAPKKTLACHRLVIDKVNIELRLPKIDWEWDSNKKITQKFLFDFFVIVLAVVVFLGQIALFGWLGLSLCSAAERGFVGLLFVASGVIVIIAGCGALFLVLFVAAVNHKACSISGDLLEEFKSRVKTFRMRVLFFSAVPLVTFVFCSIVLGWFALSLALIPVVVLVAVCTLTREHENIAMTVGIVVGVVAGFVYGYHSEFAVVGELLACVIGSAVGLVAGVLSTILGRKEVGGHVLTYYREYALIDLM